jgi:hypothetical protein
METTDVEWGKLWWNGGPPALFTGRWPARDQGGGSASWHGPCSLLVEHVKQDHGPRPPSKGRATLRPLPTCTGPATRPARPPGPPIRGQPAATTTPRRGGGGGSAPGGRRGPGAGVVQASCMPAGQRASGHGPCFPPASGVSRQEPCQQPKTPVRRPLSGVCQEGPFLAVKHRAEGIRPDPPSKARGTYVERPLRALPAGTALATRTRAPRRSTATTSAARGWAAASGFD